MNSVCIKGLEDGNLFVGFSTTYNGDINFMGGLIND